MKLSIVYHFLLSIFIFSTLQRPILAVKKSYVVYLGAHSHGSNPSVMDLHRATNSHYNLLGSVLGSKAKAKEAIYYSFNKHINAFAAILDHKHAAEIANHPDVISVFRNRHSKLHTTRSWNFLGLESVGGMIPMDSIWKKARFGEDVIIGNLDTGVWPESKSFSDEGIGPIPSRWRGECRSEDGVRCNRKLIGARFFKEGQIGVDYGNETSARDYHGHGTHTLSTVGGNFVSELNCYGFGNGTIKGGAPRARLAAYKVCWPAPDGHGGVCNDVDIMAAFDAAIYDGVDVLSLSLGTDSDYLRSGASIGAFHAVKNGIVVVNSAGNMGPKEETVESIAPWILTVGASTIDREFTSFVQLGNNKLFKGASFSNRVLPFNKLYPLISGTDAKLAHVSDKNAALCMHRTLDAAKVKGKILVCLEGVFSGIEKGMVASLAGAVGMILANTNLTKNDNIRPERYPLPASNIKFTDGELVFAYINSTEFPTAYITPTRTQLGIQPSPVMAAFSSRGPNPITPEILKPDITAPGVNIIAAYSEDKRAGGLPFTLKSGTSMSTPHVAGVAGLLKVIHPDWSPAAIKSAIMTTASTHDNNGKPMLNSFNLKATPFSYGAGHMRPNHAMDPGLVYDLTVNDYLNFLCCHGYNETQIEKYAEGAYTCPEAASILDFNYPSIAVPNLSGSVTITRRVKNVGSPGTYNARIKAPSGILASVEPKSLTFEKIGEEKEFKLVLTANSLGVAKDYVFGRLTWSDGRHRVLSQIVVKAE